MIVSIYESLLKNLKERGFNEGYKKLDIEYKNWISTYEFKTWISGWWWEYRYEKQRILLITLIWLLVFSVINFIVYKRLMEVYHLDSLDWSNFTFSENPFIRFAEKCRLSFFYTCYIFFKLGLDFENVNFSMTGYSILVFVEYSIGLLCTGYLANWILSK